MPTVTVPASESAVADLPRNPPALAALHRIAAELTEPLDIIRAFGCAVCADRSVPTALAPVQLARYLRWGVS